MRDVKIGSVRFIYTLDKFMSDWFFKKGVTITCTTFFPHSIFHVFSIIQKYLFVFVWHFLIIRLGSESVLIRFSYNPDTEKQLWIRIGITRIGIVWILKTGNMISVYRDLVHVLFIMPFAKLLMKLIFKMCMKIQKLYFITYFMLNII